MLVHRRCIGYRNPNWHSQPKSTRLTNLSGEVFLQNDINHFPSHYVNYTDHVFVVEDNWHQNWFKKVGGQEKQTGINQLEGVKRHELVLSDRGRKRPTGVITEKKHDPEMEGKGLICEPWFFGKRIGILFFKMLYHLRNHVKWHSDPRNSKRWERTCCVTTSILRTRTHTTEGVSWVKP